jgi:hypothetical protein
MWCWEQYFSLGELRLDKLCDVLKDNLQRKFSEIRRRMLQVVEQLKEDDLNWRPNEESNSIANLVVHISGNIDQRIRSGICGQPDRREREKEFDTTISLSKSVIIYMIETSFSFLENVFQQIDGDDLLKPQTVRNNQVTILDVFLQCAAHFSEHLGQILYIAKMRLDDKYISTSIPRNKDV